MTPVTFELGRQALLQLLNALSRNCKLGARNGLLALSADP
jgi:hypothetical protein